MTLHQAAEILNATFVCHEDIASKEVKTACGSDMMSDVMAFYHDGGILLTGLMNVQVIRTAILMDIDAVCFVRGKEPNEEMIDLAKDNNIVVFKTTLPMFPACGKLFASGIKGSGQETN
ncbi:MAG: DRTGG domain-containing protein [Treponema sp.]